MVSNAGMANAEKVRAGSGIFARIAEARKHDRGGNTKMNAHTETNVPGKPNVVRVKYMKCSAPESERVDDWPTWHKRTGRYVARPLPSCPNCCHSVTPVSGKKKHKNAVTFVPVDPSIQCMHASAACQGRECVGVY